MVPENLVTKAAIMHSYRFKCTTTYVRTSHPTRKWLTRFPLAARAACSGPWTLWFLNFWATCWVSGHVVHELALAAFVVACLLVCRQRVSWLMLSESQLITAQNHESVRNTFMCVWTVVNSYFPFTCCTVNIKNNKHGQSSITEPLDYRWAMIRRNLTE